MFSLFFGLFFFNLDQEIVNGDNLWYDLGRQPEISVDFCYFSGNDTQTLTHLTSSFVVGESIEMYFKSAFESILVSSGFNVSTITLPYYFTTLGYLQEINPYSFYCYTYGASLDYQDDDSNYAALYDETDDLDLITLSEKFTALMIEASNGTLNNDFRMLIFGAYLLCDIESSSYCNTDNTHYQEISTITQQTELFEQVTKGTKLSQAANEYDDYEADFGLTIRLMQIAIVEEGSDEEVVCENNGEQLSENMQDYFAPNSDDVYRTSFAYCDPNYYEPNGTNSNSYLFQFGIYHIAWTNASAFYLDYVNHGNFSTSYFGNTVHYWTENIYVTVIHGGGTGAQTEEEIISVVISCNGGKISSVCNVDEYFSRGEYADGSSIVSFSPLIVFGLWLIRVVFVD